MGQDVKGDSEGLVLPYMQNNVGLGIYSYIVSAEPEDLVILCT